MIDKTEARKLQDECAAAVEAVFEKHGLKVAKGRASYDANLFRFSVEAHATGDESPYAADWKRYADSIYHLPLEALGAVIHVSGVAYTIKGLAMSRRSFPIAVERLQDAKPMLLTVSAVKVALGA